MPVERVRRENLVLSNYNIDEMKNIRVLSSIIPSSDPPDNLSDAEGHPQKVRDISQTRWGVMQFGCIYEPATELPSIGADGQCDKPNDHPYSPRRQQAMNETGGYTTMYMFIAPSDDQLTPSTRWCYERMGDGSNG